MAEKSYAQAINEAIAEEMARDEDVFLLGEDVGVYGGCFGVSRGLLERFGPERVLDAPISEGGFVGAAVGACMLGGRPIVEIMFMDFITLAMDQIVNHAAKFQYLYDGQVRMPLVVRTASGFGRCYGATHSQLLDSWFTTVPGLKVVAPSTPYAAKGLLKSCVREDGPVIFIEDKVLYSTRGEVPAGEYTLPLGKAEVLAAGTDVTIVSYLKMAQESLRAARALQAMGISAEVIDLQTLAPYDVEAVVRSVRKTRRALLVEEGTGGVTAAIAADIGDRCFDALEAGVKRLAAKPTPIPCNRDLERQCFPGVDDIVAATQRLVTSAERPSHRTQP